MIISISTWHVRTMKAAKFSEPITRSESLNCRPVRNSHVKENRIESGEILISYTISVRPWITAIARAMGKNPGMKHERKIQLDELGTSVWDLIDGKRSVRRIIKKFAGKYHIHEKESEISVTRFLRMLGKRGLIGFK